MALDLLDDRVEVEAAAALQADRVRNGAVHLDQVFRSGGAVQPVDVLRDHGADQSAPLELRDDLVRTIRPLVAQRHEALRIEVPKAVGVAPEGVDVRDLHRVDLLPHPLPGRAEVGDPRWNRNPRSCEDDSPLRRAEQVGYSPLNCGFRLPRNAPIPSFASADWNAAAKPCASA